MLLLMNLAVILIKYVKTALEFWALQPYTNTDSPFFIIGGSSYLCQTPVDKVSFDGTQ